VVSTDRSQARCSTTGLCPCSLLDHRRMPCSTTGLCPCSLLDHRRMPCAMLDHPDREPGAYCRHVIMGSHVIVFSTDPEADRAFFTDVLGYPRVDAGGGWLIFRLPPAELAVHPSDSPTRHELYFMCDDLETTMQDLRAKGVEFTEEISEERWGRLSRVRLPGGGDVGIYEPRHPVAIDL
jgi:catechol 2,3-dioxygenase-like lactoylglutathione lyase family enzyme